MATIQGKASAQARELLNIPPVSLEEEDALIHARITNDERPLRRLTKKFHTYTSVAYPSIVESHLSSTSSIEDAREAFLIELESFRLLLRKSRMVCDAERRQADTYRKERLRIANEHEVLKNQIEELKNALEQAQIERRRKIEYDQIAEKINALPSREELESSIAELENDMQVIRDENEAQERAIHARKEALDAIVADIGQLRLLGKEAHLKVETDTPRAGSEAPATTEGGAMETEGEDNGKGHMSEGETEGTPHRLNPAARTFTPRQSTPLLQIATRNSASGLNSGLGISMDTPVQSHEGSPMPVPTSGPQEDRDSSPLSPVEGDERKEEGEAEEEVEEGEEAEDIEMGEVSERESKNRKVVEDREDGEASDESSDLSDPPDE